MIHNEAKFKILHFSLPHYYSENFCLVTFKKTIGHTVNLLFLKDVF